MTARTTQQTMAPTTRPAAPPTTGPATPTAGPPPAIPATRPDDLDSTSAGTPATAEHRPAAALETAEPIGGDGSGIGPSQLREQVVTLLTELDRPPRAVSIRVGAMSLDIEWAAPVVPVAGDPGPHLSGTGSELPATGGPPVLMTQPVSARAEPGPPRTHLTSPGVGVFYHASAPGAAPYVAVGDTVRPGQQIGIIEAMKLMVPVESDRAGRVAEVLKGDGEPVQYAEPLFALEPDTDPREG